MRGLLHTKSFTIDGDVTPIGSANMDRRNFDLNYEHNIRLYDRTLTTDVRRLQEHLMPTRWWGWWPLLLGPLGVGFVYLAAALDWPAALHKPTLERLAIGLTIASAAILLLRSAVRRHSFHVLMAALAVVVVCREFHWDWTDKTVYAALVVLAVWGWIWRGRVFPFLDGHPRTRVWFIATVVAYVFSQVIARRVFRDILPNEQALHVPLEEIAETVAHSCLLVVALLPPWRSVPSSDQSARDKLRAALPARSA